MDIAVLLLRVVVGVTLIVHGARHWRTLDGTAGWFGSIGFRQPKLQAVLSALVEMVTGALLVLGLGTVLASAAAIGTLAVAARVVHLPNGFLITPQREGVEYVLNLSVSALAVAAFGPGQWSIDRLFFGVDLYLNPGQRIAVALILGLAGASAQLTVFWRRPQAAPA
jgi:putative oxidoreductase